MVDSNPKHRQPFMAYFSPSTNHIPKLTFVDIENIKSFLEMFPYQILQQTSAMKCTSSSLTKITKGSFFWEKNKSPGADGFTEEYYQEFWPLFSHIFFSFSLTVLTTLIYLLLKPNKASTQCSSYRLLNLINTDIKIISKVLSLRLEAGFLS